MPCRLDLGVDLSTISQEAENDLQVCQPSLAYTGHLLQSNTLPVMKYHGTVSNTVRANQV